MKSAELGYFYSEPLRLKPKKTLEVSVYFKSSEATGTVAVEPYYMKDGDFITNPAGERVQMAASQGSDWKQLKLTTKYAGDTPIDAVRIGLVFDGKGTVWFDDASVSILDANPPTPLSKAIVINETQAGASGIAVFGPYGVEFGASMIGSGRTEPYVFRAQDNSIPQVTETQTDAEIVLYGVTPQGDLRRAMLQNGSYLKVNEKTFITAAKRGSFDLLVQRVADCVRVYLKEVHTLEAGPYSVAAVADEVYLGDKRVAFTVENGASLFPRGSDKGKGCTVPIADAGTDALDGGVDGATPPFDAVSSEVSDARQQESDTSGGCECRVTFAKGTNSKYRLFGLAFLLGCGWAARSERRRTNRIRRG